MIWFKLVSGLKINLYKVGEVTSFEELAGILGCEIDTFTKVPRSPSRGKKFVCSNLGKGPGDCCETPGWMENKVLVHRGENHFAEGNLQSYPKLLGCKFLLLMNEALPAKQRWRYEVEKDHLWRRVIAEKYKEANKW